MANPGLSIELDFNDAQTLKRYNDLLQKMAGQAASAPPITPKVDPEPIVDAFQKMERAASKAAEEANQHLSELVSVEKFEAFRGWLGDVRDAFDLAGQSLLGLSEDAAKAASETGYLIEKGIAVGGAFGPIGAVGGAALGTLLGWLKANNDETERAEKRLEDLKKIVEETDDAFANLNNTDLSNVISEVVRLQKELDDLKGFDEATQRKIEALGKQGLQGQAEALRALLIKSQGGETAGKSLEELLDLYDDVNAKFSDLQVTLKSAAKVTQDYADKEGLSAEAIDANQKKVQEYSDSLADLTERRAAIKAAIDEFGKSAEATADKTAKATKATKEYYEEAPDLIAIYLRDKTRLEEENTALAIENFRKYALQEAQINAEKLQTKLEQEAEFSANIYNFQKTRFEAGVAVLDKEQEAFEKAMDERTSDIESYLSAATSIFSDIGSLIEENIASNEKLLHGLARQAEESFGAILKGLGREFLVKGIGEVAAGLAVLGTPLAPTAATHFLAAAKYGAAAAIAGVGGVALSGDAEKRNREEEEASKPGGSSSGRDRQVDSAPDGSRTLRPIVINFNNAVPYTPRQAQEAAQGVRDLLQR